MGFRVLWSALGWGLVVPRRWCRRWRRPRHWCNASGPPPSPILCTPHSPAAAQPLPGKPTAPATHPPLLVAQRGPTRLSPSPGLGGKCWRLLLPTGPRRQAHPQADKIVWLLTTLLLPAQYRLRSRFSSPPAAASPVPHRPRPKHHDLKWFTLPSFPAEEVVHPTFLPSRGYVQSQPTPTDKGGEMLGRI